jgi:hypothetical protein
MANARYRLTVCLFALVLIGVAAFADAAAAKKKPPPPPKPFVLDAGSGAAKPTIAVDAAGTAHIAWNLNGPGIGDDSIVYCQVLRNARACAKKLTLAAPLESVNPPQVLLAPDGRILIVTSRCCVGAAGYPTYLLASTDGGASFAAPLEIGNNEADDAELGPGEFSVSTISDVTTGGVTFQVSPLSGPSPPKSVGLGEVAGDAVGAGYSGTIAFLDPQTPIVAMDDLEQVYFRRFGGGTAYNELAAWGPLTPVGPGSGPQLAGLPSGKQGVHMLYRAGTPGKFKLVASRYDGSAFGKATAVSETGDPIFHFFFMDDSGRLHAVWVNNEENSLTHRYQSVGQGWSPIETLVLPGKADDTFNTKAAAAADGGGFAVWDANNAGPVKAVPFGPSGKKAGGKKGGGGGDCVEAVKVGGATVTAQEGCLQQDAKDKSRYTTGGDVRVNGIDVVLGGGGARVSALASAKPKLIVDTGPRTLVTTGKVEARVGNVVLGRQVLDWKLPAGKGQIEDSAGNPAEFDTGKFHIALLGLEILGYTVPEIDGKEKVEIPINLELPAPFDSVLGKQATGSATLQATSGGGLKLSGLNVHIENVGLGIAQIKTFNILYAGDPNLLQGDTDILLPPSGAELGAAFGLKDGGFDYGRGEFTFPPGSLAVATDVLLRKIRFAVEKASSCEKPTKISGGVTLATGPEVAGTSLISVDGNVSYSFPQSSCGTPGILDIDGAGSLAGFPVANLHSRFTTDGQFTFNTVVGFDLSVASASVGIDGGVDIPSKTFYAAGKASVNAFGYTIAKANSIVSSTGVAACAPVAPVIDMGFEYRWGESLGIGNFDKPPVCDVDIESYKPAAFSRPWLAWGSSAAPRLAAASAAGSFTLPKGLPLATVQLDGAGAAPGFNLSGPGGLKISYPSAAAGLTSTKSYGVVPVGTQTFIRLENPAAGAYTVSGANGPIVTAMAVAQGLPEPRVTGKVSGGHGAGRILNFTVKRIAGQEVTFAEQGKGVKDVIGVTSQSNGVLRFKPALGVSRKRTVIAIVTQDGVPREEIEVAKFVAPPSLPGRPQGVSLKRRGKKLLVRWKRAPGASRVAVSWALADGRRQAEIVKKGRRLSIPDVPGIDSGKVEVAGLRRDNVAGKSVTVKLKAAPKHLRAKKKKRGKGRKAGAG